MNTKLKAELLELGRESAPSMEWISTQWSIFGVYQRDILLIIREGQEKGTFSIDAATRMEKALDELGCSPRAKRGYLRVSYEELIEIFGRLGDMLDQLYPMQFLVRGLKELINVDLD